VTEVVHVLLALMVPLYGGLALDVPDVAFVTVVACLVLYIIDMGAGRRGNPPIVLGAGAVLFASAIGANLLAGQPLAASAYVLALVFLGGLGSLYGRFWGTVGIAVPIALVVIAFAIGESATVQEVALGLAVGTVWSAVLTLVFGLLRPKTAAHAAPEEPPRPLTPQVRRAMVAFSMRRTGAVALAMSIGLVGVTEKPYWIILTVLVVLQPAAERSMERALQYGLGTVAGVLGSVVAVNLLGRSVPLSAVVLSLLVVAIVISSQVDYGLQTTFTTALVLTLIAIVYPGEASLFGERLLDAMAGIGIAMVVEYARLMPAVRGRARD
jgi:hypothetical protein